MLVVWEGVHRGGGGAAAVGVHRGDGSGGGRVHRGGGCGGRRVHRGDGGSGGGRGFIGVMVVGGSERWRVCIMI